MNNQIAMVGLGVMGRNLLLNMKDKGFAVSGYDRDPNKVKESREQNLYCTDNIKELVDCLRKPRVVMMLVPAGAPVDAVIESLLPYLQNDDIIIDGGNSYYKDTDARSQKLAQKGIHFFGVGISGGEEGARKGPSLMPGGSKEVYEQIKPILEAVSAKVYNSRLSSEDLDFARRNRIEASAARGLQEEHHSQFGKGDDKDRFGEVAASPNLQNLTEGCINGDPCVAYLGKGSAGHFVKMVHNGIEYGLMKLISETYDLMKRGLGSSDDDLYEVYTKWNETELNSYLVEITGKIFHKKDEKTGKWIVDEILDVAEQKGTGMWTSRAAMELQVPIPTIDLAVAMRDLSMLTEQRKKASIDLAHKIKPIQEKKEVFIEQLRQALYIGMVVTYAQGFALLNVASDKLQYGFDLESVARIWRGGCIIRAALLEQIRAAFQKDPKLPNLLLDTDFAKLIVSKEESLRRVICLAVDSAIPTPGLMSALSYIYSLSSEWMPANLIQAQRDYFGAHTYQRIDVKGTFHTEWE